MMNNSDRVQKLSSRFKWGLALLAALVVSPVIFMVVKGMIGLAIAAVVGLTIVNVAPVISMKFANWRIKSIVNEATENPIETMQNLLIDKKRAFQTFRDRVEEAVVARNNFSNKVENFTKLYPARAEEFTIKLSQMSNAVGKMQRDLKDTQQQLVVADAKLLEVKAYWDMSQALQAANKSAGMDTSDMYQKLKEDTAIDSVMNSVNAAFAQLEVSSGLSNTFEMSGQNSTPVLDYSPHDVIEFPVTTKLKENTK